MHWLCLHFCFSWMSCKTASRNKWAHWIQRLVFASTSNFIWITLFSFTYLGHGDDGWHITLTKNRGRRHAWCSRNWPKQRVDRQFRGNQIDQHRSGFWGIDKRSGWRLLSTNFNDFIEIEQQIRRQISQWDDQHFILKLVLLTDVDHSLYCMELYVKQAFLHNVFAQGLRRMFLLGHCPSRHWILHKSVPETARVSIPINTRTRYCWMKRSRKENGNCKKDIFV